MNSAVQDAARNNRTAEFKRDTGNVAVLYVCSLQQQLQMQRSHLTHSAIHELTTSVTCTSLYPTVHHVPSPLRKVYAGWRPHAALLNLDIERMFVSLAPYGAEPALLWLKLITLNSPRTHIWKVMKGNQRWGTQQRSDFLRSGTVRFIMEHQVSPFPCKPVVFHVN